MAPGGRRGPGCPSTVSHTSHTRHRVRSNYKLVIRFPLNRAAQAASASSASRLGGPTPVGEAHDRRDTGQGGHRRRGEERRPGTGEERPRDRARGVHAHDHREPHRAAELLEGLQQPGRRAGVLRLDATEDDRGDRHEQQAGREAVEQHRSEHPAGVAVTGGERAQPDEADGQSDRTGHDHRHRSDGAHDARGHPGHAEDAEGEGQEREARGHRPEAELVLDELDGEEEHRQLPADDQADRGQATDPAPAPQERGPQQRVGDAAFGGRQQGDQGRADQEAEDRAGRGPAVLGHADERPDEHDRAAGGAERTDEVEPSGPAWGLVDVAPRHREDRQPDGHVDEQRPAPGSDVGDRATEQQSQRHAAGGDRAEQGERPQPGGLVGCAGGEQREYAGRGHRRADALQGAGADEPLGRLGQSAEEGGEGEDGDAAQEQPASAEHVTQPATEQQQAAEGKGEGAQHPGEGGRAEAQIGVDLGERDVHDRRVEDEHQLRAQDDGDAHRGAAGVVGERVRERGRPGGRLVGRSVR